VARRGGGGARDFRTTKELGIFPESDTPPSGA